MRSRRGVGEFVRRSQRKKPYPDRWLMPIDRGIFSGSIACVPIVQRPRTWPFQGQNPGSNPGGDANLFALIPPPLFLTKSRVFANEWRKPISTRQIGIRAKKWGHVIHSKSRHSRPVQRPPHTLPAPTAVGSTSPRGGRTTQPRIAGVAAVACRASSTTSSSRARSTTCEPQSTRSATGRSAPQATDPPSTPCRVEGRPQRLDLGFGPGQGFA